MACLGLLRAAGPLAATTLQHRLNQFSLARWPAASRIRNSRSSKGPLGYRAHEGHGHTHTPSHTHDQSRVSCSSATSQDAVRCCGYDHGHSPDLQNPVHRLLKAAYDATCLTAATAWLEASLAATVGKVALFLVAAGAAGWAASGCAPSTAAAAAARSLSTVATAAVYLLAGLPAAVDLSYDITSGHVDTHVLMNLAVLGTLVTGHVLEGALLLVLFQTSHALEHLLTERAQGNLAALYDAMPKEAVLVGLGTDGSPDLPSARRVLAADVAVGDCMLVKPGEQVPLDGTIVHGRAMVSSEHITGESLPVLRRAGDEVAAGSLNRDGVLVLRALRVAEESTPARIAKLTLGAQAKRPQLRTWLDKFGEAYSKAVVATSVGLLAVLLLSGVPLMGIAGQRGAFYRTMGLLTVASPCALVMVPLAYVSAIAAIASRGILVKGGRVLDALARCGTVAFDKTGTLTTGSLSCTSIRPLGSGRGSSSKSSSSMSGGGGSSTASIWGVEAHEAAATKRAALSTAVALSLRSNHPVSNAVVLEGQQAGLDGSTEDVLDFELVPGGGVQGMVVSSSGSNSSGGSTSSIKWHRQQYHATFGSAEFVGSRLTAAERAALERLLVGQGTSGVLSILVLDPAGEGAPPSGSSSNGSSSGGSSSGSNESSSAASRSVWVMSFEDSVRKQSAAAVRELQTGSWAGRASQSSRLAVTMLTGDNEASAQRVARKLGIHCVAAALSPEQKLEQVQQLRERGSSTTEGGSKPQSSSRHSSGGGNQGIIMVGDGINDAPALAAADVGVAIASTATAAASLAADVIVVNGSGIAALPLLLRIARAVQAVIRQNLALAVGSMLALSLPTVLGWVPLWFAVMLHEGSTLLVALNSLRLLAFGAAPRRWQQDASAAGAAQQQGEEGGMAAAASGSGERGPAVGIEESAAPVVALPEAAAPPAA